MCKWTGLKLKPAEWYHFKVWATTIDGKKRISNTWIAVQPAFDVDKFDMTVVPMQNSLIVQMEKDNVVKFWNDLVGEKGRIMVTLIGGTKRVRSLNF